jgi:hypothetical protein
MLVAAFANVGVTCLFGSAQDGLWPERLGSLGWWQGWTAVRPEVDRVLNHNSFSHKRLEQNEASLPHANFGF